METTQPTTRRETSRRVAINRGIAKGFAMGFAVAFVMACVFWAFGTPGTPAHAEPKAATIPATITELPVPVITDAPVPPTTELPHCTDAIADAGGQCWGEPTATGFPDLVLPACVVEDGDNCYWDAHAMGNGQGWSFVTIGGITYYPTGSGL
jgi:hypothetical protein